jgi:peptide/nickel transport system substrate-binding protein
VTRRGEDGPWMSDSDPGLTRRGLLLRGAGAAGALALGSGLADPLSALAAPTGSKRGGHIKISISDQSAKDSFDPQRNSSTMGLLGAGLMYDTLLKTDQLWNITPMLAADYHASKDAKTYTFKLRKGVEFHDGKPFQAADVKYTFVRMLKGGADLHGAAIFGPVMNQHSIQIVDPYTVRFNLESADGFLPVKLAFWYGRIIQRNADFKSSAGTGPFKGLSFKGGQGFQVTRNDNYWQHGLPYLDGITGVAVTDIAAKIQSVISGDVDFSDPGDFSSNKAIKGSSGTALLADPFGNPYVMGINSKAKPYNNPDVRKAMKMLIDRKQYVSIVAQGDATPIPDYFIHPKDPFFPKGLTPPPYDPEQAKALLKKAGYGDGWSDTAWTAEFPGMPQMATLFKSSMQAAGINMAVKNVAIPQWENQLFKANIVANYWGRQHASTMAPYMAQTGGQWNEDRLSDPKIDAWIKEARASTSRAKQIEIYGELGRRYAGETACIWPFYSTKLWPYKKRLKGLQLNPTDLVDFRRATVA